MGNRISSIRRCPWSPADWCSKCRGQSWSPSNNVTNSEMRLYPMSMAPTSHDKIDSPSPEILGVRNVDLCLVDNTTQHHTNRFDATENSLIVRRGQAFKLKITFNRPFDRTKDAASFIFTVLDDEKPSYGHGTLVGVFLNNYADDLGDPLEWGAGIVSNAGDLMTVLIKPSVACPVTKWKMDIDTKIIGGNAKSYTLPQPIYILYNAWCRDDQVYMPDQEEREEFLLADTTLVYRGSYNRLRPSVWKVGQFEKNILDCSLLLISKVGRVTAPYRGDPIRTARAISAAVNSPDDDGAVLGNWSDDFSGGVAPTKWVGSVEILQKFYKKQKPVKFGQCWTFSGVSTTISRAIGIPSRIVTCYSAAHDTQASLTVDYFVDDNGKVMEEMNTDSIWNYHVWNELWMDRPDLGIGNFGSYGGWQAVDATPQEMSDGMYRCGPASVLAVKQGEILRPYDNHFVYSEVNADKVFWRYSGPYQPLKLLRTDVFGIGHFVSTKAVGKWEREDITSSYKHEEETEEERNTMLKALRQAKSAFSRYYLNENFNDIVFDFELKDDIKIGESFSVVLVIKNKSKLATHQVVGSLKVDTVLYTGTRRATVKTIAFERDIKPESSEHIRMEVSFDEYYSKLMDQCAFNISCLVSVKETEYEYFAEDDFRVRKPDIKISFQGDVISLQPVDVILRLTNPLPMPLHKGVFQVEGPGIETPLIFKIAEIPVEGTAASTFKYTPPYAGRATLAAKFTSKEIDDVDGFLAYEVEPRPEDIISNGDTTPNEIIARTDVIP